jgi:hypothetical protein
VFVLSACQPAEGLWGAFERENSTPTPFQPNYPSPTQAFPTPNIAEPTPLTLWITPNAPPGLRQLAAQWQVPLTQNPDALLRLKQGYNGIVWIYALVAPFPTLEDSASLDDLRAIWRGEANSPLNGSPLWMSESTLQAWRAEWGEPAAGVVQVAAEEQIRPLAWQTRGWAIIPFEELHPEWKVLSINGQSPIHKNFDPSLYPLKLSFGLNTPSITRYPLPASNYDPARMTVVALTGVTALVRATANKMDVNGVLYPATYVAETLRSADITHISNEVPFAENCPPPQPFSLSLMFCSDPKYIALLEALGTDVVELTGNHFQDWGSAATLMTLDMYTARGWQYYGGGRDVQDAREPALFEHNGNRFAFIGCNPVGPPMAWATATAPGAANCDDLRWMTAEIARLRDEGYLVIVTFQHFEYYTPQMRPEQRRDFRAVAEAGAVLVSGSQAHFPQVMEFHEGVFIHYGLGNLFFDQMDFPVVGTRRGTIDRHVFYNGRHISVELLPTMTEDYAVPRWMTDAERAEFLRYIFSASGW